MRKRGFTLIEMITVVAITAILLTIIIIPVIQSFNLTRQAQAFADAQQRARFLLERVTQEIETSVGVRDNSGANGAVTVVVPARPGAAVTRIGVTLENCKLDIVKAAQGQPSDDGTFINPNTGKTDPTLTAPRGQIVLPLAPGQTIVRYFVGLRDPLNLVQGYNDPYSGILMTANANQDNLYVLYRAEIQPYRFTGSPGSKIYQANTDFFIADVATGRIATDIDDPAFFTMLPTVDYNPSTFALTPAGTAKQTRIQNWQKKAVIQTEISRYDMIQPVYDKTSKAVTFDGDAPRLVPLIQFRPTRVTNEPAVGQVAVRPGEESATSSIAAPDVYSTRLGGLADMYVRLYPDIFDQTDVNKNEYEISRFDATAAPGGQRIMMFDPDDPLAAGKTDLSFGTEVFDLDAYNNGVAGVKNYPFSQAWMNANAHSAWLSDATKKAKFMPIFAPFYVLAHDGNVIASFNITEVGDTTQPVPAPDNGPVADTGPSLSPTSDTGAGAVYSGTGYQINHCFNRVWNDPANAFLKPDLHRFIDLRVTPQFDGTDSPMDPRWNDPMTPKAGFARAQIVPGSETVIGPDQNPGPNYGQPVRYVRTNSEPGPNQYRINYSDLAEPTDYTALGFAGPPPAVYDPTNFLSAVYQPRFKAGYIQLNSDPNVPLPQLAPPAWDNATNYARGDGVTGSDSNTYTSLVDGNLNHDPTTSPTFWRLGTSSFKVFYRFQFTRTKDVVAVDYDSRQIMGVELTIKNFPGGFTTTPQTATVKSTATVRNFLR